MHFKRLHITIIKGNLVFFQNIKITANLLKCLKPFSSGEFTLGRLLLQLYLLPLLTQCLCHVRCAMAQTPS